MDINNESHLTDEWGIEWKKSNEYGLYYDLCSPPMLQDEVITADIENFN